MISKSVIVNLPENMERKFAMIVQLSSDYSSKIYFTHKNKRVNGKSIMGMMALPLFNGDELTIEADGPDENEAIENISTFITSK